MRDFRKGLSHLMVFSFVCSFDETVGEDKLQELFAKYGPIKSVFVSKSPNGPRGKAFGFVDFEVGCLVRRPFR